MTGSKMHRWRLTEGSREPARGLDLPANRYPASWSQRWAGSSCSASARGLPGAALRAQR